MDRGTWKATVHGVAKSQAWQWLSLKAKCSWASLVIRQCRICLQCRRPGFNPWIRKISWRRQWQLQYSCLENSMDRGTWRATQSMGLQESDMTERLTLSLSDVLMYWICQVTQSSSSSYISSSILETASAALGRLQGGPEMDRQCWHAHSADSAVCTRLNPSISIRALLSCGQKPSDSSKSSRLELIMSRNLYKDNLFHIHEWLPISLRFSIIVI